MGRKKFFNYLFLHTVLIIYSLCGIFSKIASEKPLFSAGYLFYYSIVLLVLFTYAILWQQVLKRLPLTIAFANKAVVIIWGIVWGKIFFDEPLKIGMFIGSLLIIFGIVLVAADEQ